MLYRGESVDYGKTRLLPSVFRGYDENKEYYDALTNFSDEFSSLSKLSQLAKMQHFNYSTRLLDLTSNPLVALWFACSDYSRYREKVTEHKDGYFYVISTLKNKLLNYDSDRALLLSCMAHLKKKERYNLYKFCLLSAEAKDNEENLQSDLHSIIFDETEIKKIRDNKWEDVFEKSKGDCIFAFLKLVDEAACVKPSFANFHTRLTDLLSTFIVRPIIENERQKRQSGLFAIFGIQDELYTNKNDYYISRYRIPVNRKMHIIEELDKLDINEATLFGDIESKASYNRMREKLASERLDKIRKETNKK